MTMSPALAMVDTNVLVYTLYEDAPQHPAASHLLERAQDADAALCVSPQVLAECYAVITNPRRVSAPFTAEEALTEIEKFRAFPGMSVIPLPLDVIDRWIALLRQHPVTGRRIFDVQLVATMLGNDVKTLHTFNRADFEPFSEIRVLTPVAP